ncbi:MAG TPA: TMEM175 family protein [Gemmatimonadales bacterium]|nr:TMEM175 family protein [Gemmatimonadales bacterium]
MTESTTRLEAFSDGVFAIAITLLILEIKVPHAEYGLWAGLAALWPSYIAFAMSFIVILIMWVSHHELMHMIHRVNYPILFVNGLLLLTVTFVPFPTAVLAEHLNTPAASSAVAFYCATFAVNGLVWNVMFNTMVRSGRLRPEVNAATIAGVRRAYYLGLTVYVAAALLAFVQPWLGLLLNVSLWVLWIRLGYRSR